MSFCRRIVVLMESEGIFRTKFVRKTDEEITLDILRSKKLALFEGVVQREGAKRKKFFCEISREGRGE